ncbi:putative RNA-binding protein Luc7-like 2 isoform X1 [Condylostylus longicornis]|uniref:putative RNA-binding protein Luc7-like 2 isoform X1 n=2 Tax=Condylostylus longicornis TaxID=2530218 RepID=UPI00244DD49C|nr:putative RNA-binding protein Luc7-like 2 isoform X1 [Condylostylus longicornis]
MSATDQMRQMLDQLMGTARNGESGRYQAKFSDQRVCKSFLLGCCPHEILASTRMDLGECPKIHDLALRADYESAQKVKDYYYDIDAMEHLQAFIADCDRRTEAAKKRLAETQEELTAEVAEKANAVHALAEEIGKKLAKAEALGEAGQVEESMKLMTEIDELRAKKFKAEYEYRSSMPASTYQQQKLRVCEVCSAYLGIHDNDIRLADHFGGKLHLGFMEIREKLAELEKTAAPRKELLKKTGNYRDRDEDRFKTRYYVGGRELDRRSRVHRSKSRDRERSKRDGESSSNAKRKSKSKTRSRSRSRSRSKSHHSRRRSRSKERSSKSDRHDRDRRDREREHKRR